MSPDATEAARLLRDVVGPSLEASSAFSNREGDNEQRMQRVLDQLESAVSLIELSDPPVPAASHA